MPGGEGVDQALTERPQPMEPSLQNAGCHQESDGYPTRIIAFFPLLLE
jgi:hypothetical protein